MFARITLLLLPLFLFGQEYPVVEPEHSYETFIPVPFAKGFTLGAEFLFWKPCLTEIDFAAEVVGENDNQNLTVWYKDLDVSWTPGVRLSFYTPCFFENVALEAHYAYLTRTTFLEANGTIGTILSPLLHEGLFDFTEGQPDSFAHGKAHHDYKFHEWDFLLSYHTHGGCMDLFYHVGPAGFFFDQRLRTTLDESTPELFTAKFNWTNELWAVGFKLGSRARYCLCAPHAAFAEWNVGLYVGENFGTIRNVELVSNEEIIQWNFREPKTACFIIPAFDLKIGLESEFTLASQLFKWRFGYEFHSFWNAPTRRSFYGWGRYLLLTQSNPPNIGFFGFHGLFAGLYATF